MSALQVKDVPDDLRAELRRRADETGVSLSEFILGALRRELRLHTTAEWINRLADLPLTGPRPTRAEVHSAWEASRRDRRSDTL